MQKTVSVHQERCAQFARPRRAQRYDARRAYERALAKRKLREAELEEAEAVLSAATVRLQKPVHLEVPLFEVEAALARIDSAEPGGLLCRLAVDSPEQHGVGRYQPFSLHAVIPAFSNPLTNYQVPNDQ